MGADWHTVREGWLLDPRVGRSHTAVFEGQRGYDGKCLPKDVQAIIAAAISAGLEPKLLEAVRDTNDHIRLSASLAAQDEHAPTAS